MQAFLLKLLAIITALFWLSATINAAPGDLDPTFSGDGKLADFFPGYGNDNTSALAAQTDGKIVAVGTIDYGLARACGASRFNADGSLDASFGTDGKLTTPISGGQSAANAVVVQPDGKIIAAGYAFSSSFKYDFALARYNPNGSPDVSYGAGGKSVFNFGTVGSEEQIFGIALDGSGRAVVAGYTDGLLAVARILGDGAQTAGRTPFDFDGDGRADLGVFRPSEAIWYISGSQNGFAAVKWGISSDRLASADYDGDGKTDIAVWRESEGDFYILNSSNNSVRIENFGLAGDVLTVGDWDGDAKADVSVYRDGAQSFFFYRGSLNNPSGNITYYPFGISGDKPQRGDFDGDGKLDAAVFRQSNNTWYIRQSSDGVVRYENWGLSTDKFVPADYDGDGKTDLAVFRSGVWYLKQSSNNQARYEYFGFSTDTLVPADYDGDGKVDVAVFRNGVWYVDQSTSGALITQFGSSGDTAIPSAFINP